MLSAQKEYFDANDPVQRFLDERYTLRADAYVNRTELHAQYMAWKKSDPTISFCSASDFFDVLISKGFRLSKIKGDRVFWGLLAKSISSPFL